jgi:hypothetical protein
MSNGMATLIEIIISSTTGGPLRQQDTGILDAEEICYATDSSAEHSGREEEEEEEEDGQEEDGEEDKNDDRSAEDSEENMVREGLQKRVLESKRTAGIEKVRRFRQKLERWIGCCPICKAGEKKEEREHGWDKCERYGAAIGDLKVWIKGMETVRPDVRSSENNGRWCCCLPEQACKDGEMGGRCRWEGVIGRVAMSLLFCGPAEVRA